MKHDNTTGSARRIIGALLKNSSTVVLQMQKELAQNDDKVIHTSAGRQLNSDLNEMSAKLRKELTELWDEMESIM